MPVDPGKIRKILVVHGVQTGTDADIESHLKIEELVKNRSSGMPINFETELFSYEDINDEALGKYKQVLDFFTQKLIGKIPIGGLAGQLVDAGVDLIGDVLLNLADDTTAQTIRQGLSRRVEAIYDEGNPLYLVAHSLGSIYAFDVINNLIKEDNEYFDRDNRKTWPVQGLVTMGSPIGLSMFNRNKVSDLGEGRRYFRWINYWARTDPVVSGSFYGKPQEGYQIAETFDTSGPNSGWFIQDRVVDTGSAWLMAHVSYWDHPGIGDDLVTLITS